jgi:acyl dehydratase
LIDRKWIGHQVGQSALNIERGRLKFFAKAIGETNPIYLDEAAARAAGYADLPAPATFLFAAEMDSGAIFALFEQLGVPLANVLHGEHGFEYVSPIVAGDTVAVTSRVKNIYDKRGGSLEFIEIESTIFNQSGEMVATMRNGDRQGGGAESTAHIDGRDIKVGVNPGLMAALEQTIPLGRVGTPEEAAGRGLHFLHSRDRLHHPPDPRLLRWIDPDLNVVGLVDACFLLTWRSLICSDNARQSDAEW